MDIKVLKAPIGREELVRIAEDGFGEMVKAVVDVEQEIIAVGGEFHADLEVMLTDHEGSRRLHTWGVNIYPEKSAEERIEFDSMINLKPHYGNRSRSVESDEVKEKIKDIVKKLIRE